MGEFLPTTGAELNDRLDLDWDLNTYIIVLAPGLMAFHAYYIV